MTQAGVILGTAAYMSPEQARGKPVDKRTDIWAFGCVLYELLTGRRAFDGETVTDVLSAVVRAEPDWAALPSAAPEAVRRLLRRCLVKERAKRLPDIGAALLEIDDAVTPAASGTGPAAASTVHAPARVGVSTLVSWAVASVLAAALVWQWVGTSSADAGLAPATSAVRFLIDTEAGGVRGSSVPQFAVSPDGRHVVIVGASTGGAGLWLRHLDNTALVALPNTNGAAAPFWSPDSRSVGYFAGGRLKTVSIDGGPSVDVCAATPESRGGTWSRTNDIVFSDGTVLQRVRASGGAPAPVSVLDTSERETSHRFPQFLDDRQVLYFSSQSGRTAVKVVSSGDARVTGLLRDTSRAIHADGHLLYVRNGTLVAQAFDPVALRLNDMTTPLAEVDESEQLGHAPFSVVAGVLAFTEGAGTPAELVWRDRAGTRLGTVAAPDDYRNGILAPDATRVAAMIIAGRPQNRDLWVIDVARGSRTRITSDPAADLGGAWSPDGRSLAYVRSGANTVLVAPADGGPERSVARLPVMRGGARSWSPDGRHILVNTRDDMWIVAASGSEEPVPFAHTAAVEGAATFSPDGRWIAHSSNESGRLEVYVQPYPATGMKLAVSREGGTEPDWRGDGRELYFLGLDGRLMAVPVDLGTQPPQTGVPAPLFDIGPPRQGMSRYDVTRDGKRFLVVTPVDGRTPPVTVVLNWRALVARP